MPRPQVVIIGGGFCGVVCAKHLMHKADVTLISSKPYFEFTPAVPRLLTDTGLRDRIRLKLSDFLAHVRIIPQPVTRVTPREVHVGKQVFPFQYLVIARGVEYPIFLKGRENVFTVKDGEQALAAASSLEQAKTVLIIGGGLIGTEVAGELCTKTDAKVAIVHPMPRLLERNPERASSLALGFLKKRGCQIILGEKLVGRKGLSFVTDKDRVVDADVAFWCAGISSDVSFLSDDFHTSLTERGSVRVNDFLQVEGFPTIFAGGDVNSIQEEKTAQNAERHGCIIAKNIMRHSKGKSLKKYAHFIGPLVISLGDWSGIFAWKGRAFGGVFPALLKRAIEWWTLFKLKWV